MKIILINDIKKLGKYGDIKVVKPGYARNYLLPYKKAVLATKKNITLYEKQINTNKILNKKSSLIEEYKLNILNIKKLKELTFSVKVNNYGTLFGSITKKDIIKRLKDLNILIKYENIKQKVYIDRLGCYDIEISFLKKYIVNLQINIVRSV